MKLAILLTVWGGLFLLVGLDLGSSQLPVQTSAPRAVAPCFHAEHYAAVLSACFNGQQLTDGVRTIRCREVK